MTVQIASTTKSLPIALLRARERVMGPIRTVLVDLDLTEQQWRVLKLLYETGPMKPTLISDQACLLLPSLTRILQKLEEKSLIRRNQDKRDKRRQIVTITKKGTSLINAHMDKNIQILEDVRKHMGPERYELLIDLLSELVAKDA